MRTRAKRRRNRTERPQEVVGRTPQRTRLELALPDSDAGEKSEFRLLLVCFFLSGAAALLYQTAWMRQFAVVFGTSELATATVLAAYMSGLAAGSWIAGRSVDRVRRLLLTYGALEFSIAAGALLVPLGLSLARWILVALIGGQPTPPDAGGWRQPAIYVATTFVILMVPTACMGATLPLLARHAVRRSSQIGQRIGLLYAMNTFGAVVGTVVAGFVLLPSIGLFRTTLCGAALNAAVFGIAIRLRNSGEWNLSPVRKPGESLEPAKKRICFYRGCGTLMPLMLVSGFVSFVYEVLWSRLLGHVIGGSTHAFATMLATFLAGITLGSMIAAPLARDRRSSLWGFLLAQVGTAVSSMGLFWFLEAGAGWLNSADKAQLSPVWNAMTCSLALFPATICIGMTFPFAVRGLTEDADQAGPLTGRLYAWNTVGGVIGALAAGFVLIPLLSFTGTIQLAVAANLLLALAALLLLRPPAWATSGALASVILFGAAYQPETPLALLGSSTMSDKYEDELVYLGVGRSSTVRVGETPRFYALTNNGLPEALISPKGAPGLGMQLSHWLTALPLIARPDAESICVVGFGSGGSVEMVPSSVREIDVIELEPLVIEANRRCAPLRRYDPLADSRINIIINDARGALSLTDRRYDIVVSQPSHPWTAGASHLYTKEFMELVRDHLAEEGVFLQWMNTSFVDDELFRTLGSTLLSVFPNVRLYQPTANVMFFLASAGDLDLERALLQTGEPLRTAPDVYAEMGLTGISSLSAALRLDESGMREICAGASPNTDDKNRLAFAASHNRAERARTDLSQLLHRYDALLNRDSALYCPDDLPLNPALVAARLNRGGFADRLESYRDSFAEPAGKVLIDAVALQQNGRTDEAIDAFIEAQALDGSQRDAAWMACELSVSSLAVGAASTEIEAIAESLPEPEHSVLRAAIALKRDDFESLRRLEPRLAEVKPEQSCYGMALNCRAAWRAAAVAAPNRAQLASEAIVLADRSNAVQPRTETFLMRFNAVAMLDDPHGVTETALSLVFNRYAGCENPAQTFRQDGAARVVIPKLQRLQTDPRVRQSRLQIALDAYQRMKTATTPMVPHALKDALPY